MMVLMVVVMVIVVVMVVMVMVMVLKADKARMASGGWQVAPHGDAN